MKPNTRRRRTILAAAAAIAVGTIGVVIYELPAIGAGALLHPARAAVALQEAADDSRPAAIVAAETFSDLRTVATERAPFVFTRSITARAFELAERQGHFRIDAVSPAAAAARISIPVLVIHGAADHDTPPAHSQRVYAALKGPKRLVLVPNAGHNGSLRAEVWQDIERW